MDELPTGLEYIDDDSYLDEDDEWITDFDDDDLDQFDLGAYAGALK